MKKEKTVKDEPAFVSAPLGIGKNTHRHISLEKQKQNLETRIFFCVLRNNMELHDGQTMSWIRDNYQFRNNRSGLFQLYPARALRALGLLLADGAPTVGGGKTF